MDPVSGRVGMWFGIKNVMMFPLLAASLFACSTSDVSDLKQFVEQEKAKPAGHVKPLPQPQEYTSFEYDLAGLRDPFVPLQTDELTETFGDGGGPDEARAKEALETFPLDTLRMVGTLRQNEVTWGLIRVPGGTVHRVRVDNFMGQNHGKITVISSLKIELLEFINTGQGWVDRKATLALSQ